MLNIEGVLERIQMLIHKNDLNASSFAQKIGVQRSSMSHILSGRNKPSLEFLAKIEAAFSEVTFSWLLKGEEEFHQENPISPPTPQKFEQEIQPASDESQPHLTFSDKPTKIVHYYEDGSFETFHKR